jgi:hypothetical protein
MSRSRVSLCSQTKRFIKLPSQKYAKNREREREENLAQRKSKSIALS